MKTKSIKNTIKVIDTKILAFFITLTSALLVSFHPAVSGFSTSWYVHCERSNPLQGCGCVNHDMNSYNPVQIPPHIVLSRVSWEDCGKWMYSHGFPGWEDFAGNAGRSSADTQAPQGKYLFSFRVSSSGKKTDYYATVPVGHKIYIVVRGTVNFSKPRKHRLINDACYEFNSRNHPVPISIFRGSRGYSFVNVCSGEYNPNHTYRSAPFIINDNGFGAWIYDSDYRDNSGYLTVDVYSVTEL